MEKFVNYLLFLIISDRHMSAILEEELQARLEVIQEEKKMKLFLHEENMKLVQIQIEVALIEKQRALKKLEIDELKLKKLKDSIN